MRRTCFFAQLQLPGLGDLVQRNILLGVLRRAHPGASVTLVVGTGLAERYADLLPRHVYAEDLMRCPDPGDTTPEHWRAFLAELADRRFELCVVDPGSHTLGAGHAERARIPRRVGVARGRASDRQLSHPVRLPPPLLGVSDLYEYANAFARALGARPLRPAEVVPDLPRQPEKVPELDAPGPRIGVHPGGQPHWNRRWPLDRYAELCVRLVADLGASLYLLGADGERAELAELRDRITAAVPAAVPHVEAGGALNRTANLVAGLDLLVGNDSGLAHLAAAVGTSTVVLYGPTGTEPLWARVYPRHRGVSLHYPCQAIRHEPDQAAGRRCAHGCVVRYQGPRGPYPRCLVDLDVDRVWAATTAQLRAQQRSGGGHVR
ncbi:glycosyltransferase family 9 protein [Plantactinospora sp. KLBMP9567]|uniref:glycosyltransferase family 9 protein n=1 Tax=Plantactinospora sp. KLBMP9567 TaxID=3085900 RepID=UPI002980D1CA|nr:glycosyltransferase family 9 protein [Plantactinospora sp. KLBMP9567]MDW5324857.1 glycosyltransferase family 9 protein [Plantactinospora sp. KLBMP9567]